MGIRIVDGTIMSAGHSRGYRYLKSLVYDGDGMFVGFDSILYSGGDIFLVLKTYYNLDKKLVEMDVLYKEKLYTIDISGCHLVNEEGVYHLIFDDLDDRYFIIGMVESV